MQLTMHYCTVQYITLQYSTCISQWTRSITVHYITVHYLAIQYMQLTVHYCTVHYSIIHYSTIPYIIIPLEIKPLTHWTLLEIKPPATKELPTSPHDNWQTVMIPIFTHALPRGAWVFRWTFSSPPSPSSPSPSHHQTWGGTGNMRARHAILFVKTGGTRGSNTLCRIVRPVSLPSLPQVTLWNNVETWTYHKNTHKTLVLQKLTMTGWRWRQSPWCPLSFWTTGPGFSCKVVVEGGSNSRPKIVRPDPCKMWGDRYLNSLCRIDRPVSLPSLPQMTLWNSVETWT